MTNYLTKHAYFTNKFDMDAAATQHRQEHWQAMNNTDRDVLDVIRRYSVKFGAAHLKYLTIEKAIGKSNATVRRSIRKLTALGIIDKIHYVRPVMNGLGANIYAIRPYQIAEKVEDKQVNTTPEILTNETNEIPETAQLTTTLFGKMKALLSSTIGNATLARRFFAVYRQLTVPMLKFSIHEAKTPLFEQLAIQAMQVAVQATKRKNILNLPGYYSGVLRKLIDDALFSDAFLDYDVAVEFWYPGK